MANDAIERTSFSEDDRPSPSDLRERWKMGMLQMISRHRARALAGVAVCLVSASAPAWADACPPGDVIVATTPAPPQESRGMNRFLSSLETPPPADSNVVVFGDSIVRRWPAELLQNAFPGKSVGNAAISGLRTQTALWSLDTGKLDQLRPETVMLLLGTNNIRAIDPCAIGAGVAAVVDKIQKHWRPKHLIVIGLLPRSGGLTAQTEQVNDSIAQIPNIKMLRLGGSLTCEGDTAKCELYMRDGLHPSAKGYESMTDYLRSELQR